MKVNFFSESEIKEEYLSELKGYSIWLSEILGKMPNTKIVLLKTSQKY